MALDDSFTEGSAIRTRVVPTDYADDRIGLPSNLRPVRGDLGYADPANWGTSSGDRISAKRPTSEQRPLAQSGQVHELVDRGLLRVRRQCVHRPPAEIRGFGAAHDVGVGTRADEEPEIQVPGGLSE